MEKLSTGCCAKLIVSGLTFTDYLTEARKEKIRENFN